MAARARSRLCGADRRLDAGLQILNIGRRPFVQDDKVDSELSHAPVFMRVQRFAHGTQVFRIVDEQNDQGQIARNAHVPQARLRTKAAGKA